ncbi:hypothetical protein ACLRGF_10830 [Mycetocola zhadangensis]|uniref:hypothetical protein n=1 Tax=Mycetocola zhadangensis TaxID=1164595 RepID=UPI003A4D877C
MARLHLHPDRLEIALSTAEKTLSLRKDNIIIPRSAIRSATLTDDPWIWVRGIRAPGAAIPLTLAVGQWKFHGGKDFLVLKGTKPSVVIDIADEEFSRVIITTKHGLELVAKLQLDVKPVKKTARARKATPQVTPKPKRVSKPRADAPASDAGTAPVVEAPATPTETPVTPAKKAAAAKPARAVKTPAKAPAKAKIPAEKAPVEKKSAEKKPAAAKKTPTPAKKAAAAAATPATSRQVNPDVTRTADQPVTPAKAAAANAANPTEAEAS